MDVQRRVILSLFVLIVLVVGLYFFTDWFSKVTGYSTGEDERVKLADCLAEKGAVLFITSNCLECERQMEIFGSEGTSHLPILQCSSLEDCPSSSGFPSWLINGEKISGVQEIDSLKLASQCD